jgi:hypothetical protein
MPVKKLSIKTKKVKGKPKLVIHKSKPKEEEGDADKQIDIEEVTESTGEVQAEASSTEQIPDTVKVKKVKTVKKKPAKLKIAAVQGLQQVGQEVIGEVVAQPSSSGEPDIDMQELVKVIKATAPMVNVGFGMDRTINLGNYENVKIHVAIHVPSEIDVDEIEGNYVFAKGWVEEKMSQTVKKYVGDNAE